MSAGNEVITLAGGCFWCLEAVYDQIKGVVSVESGYIGGVVENPSYEAVCSGRTGHAEAVRVTYNPEAISCRELIEIFFSIHDPTTLNRQGNDEGTQYRSVIFTTTAEQLLKAQTSRTAYQNVLLQKGYGAITTDIAPAPTFYIAEDYHQQYLAKNPNGYCGLGGTGVLYPMPASGQ